MTRERGQIDETLVARVAALPPGAQRWLKTAIQSIRTMPAPREADIEAEAPEPEPPRQLRPGRAPRTRPDAPKQRPARRREPANLEDVITGKADLRDQLKDYPELSEELDGLADIIDMLRDAGERRRKLGEDILRRDILGAKDDEPAGDGEEEL